MDWIKNRLEMVERSIVGSLSHDVRLKSVHGIKSTNERLGMLADMVKDAVAKAPVGVFNSELYAWTGKIYEKIAKEELSSCIYESLQSVKTSYTDLTKVSMFVKVATDFLTRKILTPNKSIMVFKNCVYNISRHVVDDFHPKYVQMWQVDYDYDKDCIPVLWERFLNQVLPDMQSRGFLQEFLGAAFVPREKASIEKMLILLGSGANGKSVVYNVLQYVLGIDNVCGQSVSSLVSANNREINVASINGKRLNYCSEIETAMVKFEHSDTLKKLISGEPLMAKVLYKDTFQAREIPLMMANANYLPKMADNGFALRRRIAVVKFPVRIPKQEQDTMLADKLRNECAGIFNWIMEGRDRFVLRGCRLPELPEINFEKEKNVIASKESNIYAWLESAGYSNDKEFYEQVYVYIPSKKLYAAYNKWCMNNQTVPENMIKFGKEMLKIGFPKRHTRDGQEYGMRGKALAAQSAAEAIKKIHARAGSIKTLWYTPEGNPLVFGEERLASSIGVARKIIRKFVENGQNPDYKGTEKLVEGEHYTFEDGKWKCFDALKCMQVFADNEILLTDSRREQVLRKRKKDNTMREKFNTEMRKLGLPYRKLLHPERVQEGCEWVSDDTPIEDILFQEGMADKVK